MKKNIFKILSVVLAFMLSVGCTSIIAYKEGNTEGKKKGAAEVKAQSAEEDGDAISKDETVYVIAGADGAVQKVIVSDWIKNAMSADKIIDKTDLTNVKNVKGNEKYTMNSDNMKVWDAEGNDIYYQGSVSKDLPVNLAVSYTLDGKAVSPKKLAGKSGKVTMRFDYKNNQTQAVEINGKEETIYVPFLMVTGMMLDNDNFRNVEVSNGKLINDGDHSIVMGIAMPGLQEDLAIDKEKFEIPNYVEITADVKNFSLATTLTLATNEVMSKVDTSKLDSLDELDSKLDTLTSAMNQLLDGSSQLYNGTSTLLSKSDELINGVDKLADGAKSLKKGTTNLAGGVAKLKEGADQLSVGLETITSKNQALTAGAETVYNTLLGTVQSQIAANGVTVENLTIDNYKTVLSNLTANPTDTQKAELIAIASKQVDAQLSTVPDAYKTAAKVILSDKVSAGESLETAQAELTSLLTDAGTVQQISASAAISPDATVYAYLVSQGYDAQSAGLIAKICAYDVATKGGSAMTYIQSAAQLATNAKTVQTASQDPNSTVKINGLCLGIAVKTLKPTIDGALTQLMTFDTFYQGIIAYTGGVSEVAVGADTLSEKLGEAKTGANQLKDGANQLSDGLNTLNNSCGDLKDGVSKLNDGAMQLNDGLKQFNEQGVKKITDAVGGDLSKTVARLKATVNVSKTYKSFGGISDDMNGSVKFIYKTEEIK